MGLDLNGQLDVRPLGADSSQSAALESLNGGLLRIRLAESSEKFGVGTLVEVRDPVTLYLGEIRSREANLLTVGIEHALNREALRAIQQVWSKPGTPTE